MKVPFQQRRHWFYAIVITVAIALLALAGHSHFSNERASASPQTDPSAYSAVTISGGQIDSAIAQLDRLAARAIDDTGLPGLAIAVVRDGQLAYARGLGVRQLGSSDPVDENTVFQLASLSKPIGATVVAGVVGDGVVSWSDRIVDLLPDFALADTWVTENVTVADLYSHRSGPARPCRRSVGRPGLHSL